MYSACCYAERSKANNEVLQWMAMSMAECGMCGWEMSNDVGMVINL